MYVLGVANPTTEPPLGPAQLDSEEDAVGTHREQEFHLALNLEPPCLLEICNSSEPAFEWYLSISSEAQSPTM